MCIQSISSVKHIENCLLLEAFGIRLFIRHYLLTLAWKTRNINDIKIGVTLEVAEC